MIGLHLESLDKNRLEVFDSLSKLAKTGVLAEGTAIALQIGHRKSYDFDIFTFAPLETDLFRKCKRIFGEQTVKMYESGPQLNIFTPQSVKVTFYYDGYPPSFPSINTGKIDLLDLRDLASNKALTLGGRGKWRDYVDLYFLIRDGWVSLKEIFEIAEKRFLGEFSRRLCLQQLVYFGDLVDFGIEYLGNNVEPKEIQNFFYDQVKKLVDQ